MYVQRVCYVPMNGICEKTVKAVLIRTKQNMKSSLHSSLAIYIMVGIIVIYMFFISTRLVGNKPIQHRKYFLPFKHVVPVGQQHQQVSENAALSPHNSVKVAFVVVYYGEALPPWLRTFELTAGLSGDSYEWIIFLADKLALPLDSKNVRYIHLSVQSLVERIATLDISLNKNHLHKLLANWPYFIVELKPCLGILFADYLKEFTHWGYADIDQLFGNLTDTIPLSALQNNDIYTTHFGDNFRLYARGQMTVHKNNPHVNNIWRSCRPLSQISRRLDQYYASSYSKWHLESAEGCYSKSIALSSNLKVYFAANQMSDALPTYHASSKEMILFSDKLVRCYTEATSSTQSSGEKELIKIKPIKYNCAYWINPAFQVGYGLHIE